MARLTRAQLQELNRAKVLAAARREFAEYGYREAKIDNIAERAELTRGAVYSNFPGKRALYFAVLAEEAAGAEPAGAAGRTDEEALRAFARAWLARLPLAEEAAPVGSDLISEIMADELTRRPYAQLLKLQGLLLALALERLGPEGGRRVKLAETALTILHGAVQLSAAAPGFVEPFAVAGAIGQLMEADLEDGWPPPHLAFAPVAAEVDEPWAAPLVRDEVGGGVAPVPDGVVAVLGLHRIEAVEEAVRAGGGPVTAVLVTPEPAELAPLARLTVAEVAACLRQAFPAAALPEVRVVIDESGTLAAAAGVREISGTTQSAIRIAAGRIVARADGYGACHAASVAGEGPVRRRQSEAQVRRRESEAQVLRRDNEVPGRRGEEG
ncbi:TetR/AcrR family transcriptional regulator [Nonomuraea typhae]|uniref:TetR/AcrR family transcriptional regulator n=1 Tax=Nonomuraea typhae TaxID=2603600 RepID=UPI0012F8C842|nr:TetR/AcrR family transcriptional regulator [Nonomuraea typhae]